MFRAIVFVCTAYLFCTATTASAFCCSLANQLMSGLVSLSVDQSLELAIVNASKEQCSFQVEVISQDGTLLHDPVTVVVMSGKSGVFPLGTGRDLATAAAPGKPVGRRERPHVNVVVAPLSDTCSQWNTSSLEVINSNSAVYRGIRLQ